MCCGAPWLHQGDVDALRRAGPQERARSWPTPCARGNDIVVPQPTCGYILKKDYVDYIGGPDAELVAEHTYDAAEYLWKRPQGARAPSSTPSSPARCPRPITYHAPCHLRAQNIGLQAAATS